MNSTDSVAGIYSDTTTSSSRRMLAGPIAVAPIVRIKALAERDRRPLLQHFLALDSQDRLLRFGSPFPDDVITRYVQKINLSRDAVFGVYDEGLQLAAVGHLAYLPSSVLPDGARPTAKPRVAEFGVSVLAAARGLGIGSRLFERAAMHCRNGDIDTLYMHCLHSNQVMMHIARKAGMAIQRDHGEADAYLKLAPANPVSVMQEAIEEQAASVDYVMKLNTRAWSDWLRQWPGLNGA